MLLKHLQQAQLTLKENSNLDAGCVTTLEWGVGQSPTVAERKPAPCEIPHAWLVCASVAANARPGYPGSRAIEVEVIPAGRLYVAQAVIREGSRHIARLVGDFCPTEREALHSLEPLFVRFTGDALGKTP